EDLSLVPQHRRYAPDVVGFSPLKRHDARDDILPVSPPLIMVLRESDLLPNEKFNPPTNLDGLASDSERLPLLGGSDGLETLTVSDFIGQADDFLGSDAERERGRRGLRALELIDEVSILAVPDIHIRPISAPTLLP